MIHRLLMHLTHHRPMKQINVQGKPYLQRYCMGTVRGRQVWLHRFLSADGERHLHSHPWSATSVVLRGSYTQETEAGAEHRRRWTRQRITPSMLHRIFWAEPDTWTLMIVGRDRLPLWHFIDEDGKRTAMKSGGTDWWRGCGTRAEANP